MKTFVFLTDLHYGYERDAYRHKRALHDSVAMSVALQFITDLKPDHIILGGDILDCAVISHHNRNKPGRTEGLRLVMDAQELRAQLITPLEQQTQATLHYIVGNHEAWLTDLIDDEPGLEGVFDLKTLLGLDRWNVQPQGGHINLGKLTFIHGDQLRGGEHTAKAAVIAYERSMRFGHFHTLQMYSKSSALDIKHGKTGMAVPCLCRKDPRYGKGAPNRWCQGFLYGYILPDGTYHDYPVVIINGRAVINGREYRG
jgi:UDP-2,3-diacylglucosamine pyrophosphatase LpxH